MLFRLVYTPEGADRQEFDFDPDNPLSIEAEAVEAVGGDVWDSWPAFLMKVADGNTRARRGLLWMMLRRGNPQLRFSDLVFRLDEFGIEEVEVEPVGKDEPGGSDTDSPSPPLDSPAE